MSEYTERLNFWKWLQTFAAAEGDENSFVRYRHKEWEMQTYETDLRAIGPIQRCLERYV